MAQLRREYLAELPAQLDEIRAEVQALRDGSEEAATSLRTRFHRLAGSGGSYGFPEISAIARQMERLLATGPSPSQAERIEDAVDRLAAVVQPEREG